MKINIIMLRHVYSSRIGLAAFNLGPDRKQDVFNRQVADHCEIKENGYFTCIRQTIQLILSSVKIGKCDGLKHGSCWTGCFAQ